MSDSNADDLEIARLLRSFRRTEPNQRAARGSPSQLVRVLTTPVTTGNFFLAKPQILLGSEVEGGAPSVSSDASDTILVYPLKGGLIAGSNVVATFVPHRWETDDGKGSDSYYYPPPPCGSLCVTVTGCGGPLQLAYVELLQGGVPVAACYTYTESVDCCFAVSDGVVYQVRASFYGFDSATSAPITGTCSVQSVTLNLTPTGGRDCGCCVGSTPDTLNLTDKYGTWAATRTAPGAGSWRTACLHVSEIDAFLVTYANVGGTCVAHCAVATLTVPIQYLIQCSGDVTDNNWTLTKSVTNFYCGNFFLGVAEKQWAPVEVMDLLTCGFGPVIDSCSYMFATTSAEAEVTCNPVHGVFSLPDALDGGNPIDSTHDTVVMFE